MHKVVLNSISYTNQCKYMPVNQRSSELNTFGMTKIIEREIWCRATGSQSIEGERSLNGKREGGYGKYVGVHQ